MSKRSDSKQCIYQSSDSTDKKNSDENSSSHISMDDLVKVDDTSSAGTQKLPEENSSSNNFKHEEDLYDQDSEIKQGKIKEEKGKEKELEEINEEEKDDEINDEEKDDEIKESEEDEHMQVKKEAQITDANFNNYYNESSEHTNNVKSEEFRDYSEKDSSNMAQKATSINSKEEENYNQSHSSNDSYSSNKNQNQIQEQKQNKNNNSPKDNNKDNKDINISKNNQRKPQNQTQNQNQSNQIRDLRSKNILEYPTRPTISDQDRAKFTTYKVQSNFFKVLVNTDTIYKYSLEFLPHIEGDAVYVRKRILFSVYKEIEKIYGNFHYNGTMIFAPNNLQFSPPSQFQGYDKLKNPFTVIVKYAGQCDVNEDSDYMPIIKSFCKKSLAGIGQVNIKGAYFSDKESKTFKEFKFQLWQGFKPSVKRNNNTFYINLLPLSKVIRTKSALEELKEYQHLRFNQSAHDFQNLVREKFRNASVLTRYNGDKNYVIIDIDFTKSPIPSFSIKKKIDKLPLWSTIGPDIRMIQGPKSAKSTNPYWWPWIKKVEGESEKISKVTKIIKMRKKM